MRIFGWTLCFVLAFSGIIHGGEIHEAAGKGDVERGRGLLKADPQLVNAKDSSGLTPLWWAVRERRKDMVALLLADGADVHFHERFQFGWMAEDICRILRDYEELEKAKQLVKTHPELINKGDDLNRTLLHWAAANGECITADFLLSNKADVNARNKQGETPLHWAISSGSSPLRNRLEVIKVLLAHRADINAKAIENNLATPLHRALYLDESEIVTLLLDKKADPNAKDNDGATPLQVAIERTGAKWLELLLTHGADINGKGTSGWTPLHMAVFTGGIPLAKLLLNHKADVNARELGGFTPLFRAVERGEIEMVEFLLANKADVNAKTDTHPYQIPSAWTLLHQAVCCGRKEVVKVLLRHKADPNGRDNIGRSPLHWAAGGRDSHGMVGVLLANGADVNARDGLGGTSLQSAAFRGDNKMIKEFLANKADVTIKDRSGNTALKYALVNHHPDSVKILKLAGAAE